MGQSTDALIAYGVDFGEEAEFPWHGEEWDEDIEYWWRDVNGFVNPIPRPNWGAPEWERDVRTQAQEQQVEAYFKARRQWDEEHPLPIDLIGHCSGEYRMWILAVRGTCVRASRGDPVKLDTVFQSAQPDSGLLIKFCKDYGIELPAEPAWLLFSDWS